MAKYVFCDLDYTLLNNNREISKDNYDAIKKFEEKGNHFIICSGRVPFALEVYRKELGSRDVITSNGALIISEGKIIKNMLLSKDIIIPIINYAIEKNVCVRIFTSDFLFVLNKEKMPPRSFLYKESIQVEANNVFDEIEKYEIIKLVINSDDKHVLEEARKHIISLKVNVEMTYSSNVFLEINAINQNKGNGIIDYCKLKNIDIKDTISIGDNNNDLPMLEITGFSACPSNAIEDVKQVVDYVCINDNNNGAIKEVLERLQGK